MAKPAILLHDVSDGVRREERWRVRLGVRTKDSKPAAQSLTILDLSLSGILFETDQPLKIHSYLIVDALDEVAKICRHVWNSG